MFNIGISIAIIKDDKILVGIRGKDCKVGKGLWALPGGALEPGELIENAILRETTEECGLIITFDFTLEAPIFAVTNTESYIELWAYAYWVAGDPVIKKPTKCDKWEWMNLEEISKIDGVHDPDSQEYSWLPYPLLNKHLSKILSSKLNVF